MRSRRRILHATTAFVVASALVLAGCGWSSPAPDYGPIFDRMERAVPQVVRTGSETSDDSHCTVDDGSNGYVERRYRPADGVSVVAAERAVFDYFEAHGYSSDNGDLGTPEDEAEMYPRNWEQESTTQWIIGSRWSSDNERETNRITLRIEKKECE